MSINGLMQFYFIKKISREHLKSNNVIHTHLKVIQYNDSKKIKWERKINGIHN